MHFAFKKWKKRRDHLDNAFQFINTKRLEKSRKKHLWAWLRESREIRKFRLSGNLFTANQRERFLRVYFLALKRYTKGEKRAFIFDQVSRYHFLKKFVRKVFEQLRYQTWLQKENRIAGHEYQKRRLRVYFDRIFQNYITNKYLKQRLPKTFDALKNITIVKNEQQNQMAQEFFEQTNYRRMYRILQVLKQKKIRFEDEGHVLRY